LKAGAKCTANYLNNTELRGIPSQRQPVSAVLFYTIYFNFAIDLWFY
jgi:hypothetical protein